VEAIGATNAGFCDACLTGRYPVEVPVNLTKGVLEPDAPDPAELAGTPTTLHLLFEGEVESPAEEARNARRAEATDDGGDRRPTAGS
jgi:hypothetical protein